MSIESNAISIFALETGKSKQATSCLPYWLRKIATMTSELDTTRLELELDAGGNFLNGIWRGIFTARLLPVMEVGIGGRGGVGLT